MELCIHHIFVMLRVLKLPANNPIIWQLSLNGTAWQADSSAFEQLYFPALILSVSHTDSQCQSTHYQLLTQTWLPILINLNSAAV